MITAFIIWIVALGFFLLAAEGLQDRIYYTTIMAIPAVVFLTAISCGW